MRLAHVLVTVIALNAGCSHFGRAWTDMDPWYHAADVHLIDGWQDVSFTPVAPSRLDEAIALVTDAPAVPIDAQTAELLTDGTWDAEGPAFAVRAVFLNEGSGGFEVQTKERMLWVHHGSLGRGAVPMKRAVLVVGLPELPEAVYVTCSMAQ